MKQFISKTIGFMLVLAMIFTSIPAIQVQAASKPVISSSQVKIKKNACSVKKGEKIKLIAKYGQKNIIKKCTWISSKKSVATISESGVLTAKKTGITYLTVKYKGKTSPKLKVVVKANYCCGYIQFYRRLWKEAAKTRCSGCYISWLDSGYE